MLLLYAVATKNTLVNVFLKKLLYFIGCFYMSIHQTLSIVFLAVLDWKITGKLQNFYVVSIEVFSWLFLQGQQISYCYML